MPKKSKAELEKERQEAEANKNKLEPVAVTVTNEHIATPHSIEVRKNDDGLVIEARTEDWKHTYTIGAKTVESIIRDAGADLPTGNAELEITFSPHNGELIAVRLKSQNTTELEQTE